MSNPFVTTGAFAFASESELQAARAIFEAPLGELHVGLGLGVASAQPPVLRWATSGTLSAALFEPGLVALGQLTSRATHGSALWALGGEQWVTEIRIAEAETSALEGAPEVERGALRDQLREARAELGAERPDEQLAAALWEGRKGWVRLRALLSDAELVASLDAFDARRALGESFGLRELDRASLDELEACVGDRVLLLCSCVDGPYRLDARRRCLELLATRAPVARAADELVAFAALDPSVSKRAMELLAGCPPELVLERCIPYLERRVARYKGAREELELIWVRVARILAALPPSPDVAAVAAKALRRKVSDPAYAEALAACAASQAPVSRRGTRL